MPEPTLAQTTGKDNKRYLIEDAARTLKRFAAIKRDKALMKAARAYLKQEIKDTQTAIKTS